MHRHLWKGTPDSSGSGSLGTRRPGSKDGGEAGHHPPSPTHAFRIMSHVTVYPIHKIKTLKAEIHGD